MLSKKLSAIEGRLAKMMSRNEKVRGRLTPAHDLIKKALECFNEGDHQKALDHVMQFNTIMQDYKLNSNV
jgi:hypothetical protein